MRRTYNVLFEDGAEQRPASWANLPRELGRTESLVG
jgi:hypothetical protein